jgi:hypothetical protein
MSRRFDLFENVPARLANGPTPEKESARFGFQWKLAANPLEAEPEAETRTVPASTVVGVAVPAPVVGVAIPATTPPTTPTPTTPTPTPAPRFCRCAGCSGDSGGQRGYADCRSDRRSHRADAPKDRDSHGRDSFG